MAHMWGFFNPSIAVSHHEHIFHSYDCLNIWSSSSINSKSPKFCDCIFDLRVLDRINSSIRGWRYSILKAQINGYTTKTQHQRQNIGDMKALRNRCAFWVQMCIASTVISWNYKFRVKHVPLHDFSIIGLLQDASLLKHLCTFLQSPMSMLNSCTKSETVKK